MKLLNTTGQIDVEFQGILEDATFKDLSENCFFEERIAPWIAENVDPRMVFEEDTLCEWAKQMEVESVCKESNLHMWAIANGYTKDD